MTGESLDEHAGKHSKWMWGDSMLSLLKQSMEESNARMQQHMAKALANTKPSRNKRELQDYSMTFTTEGRYLYGDDTRKEGEE